MSIKINKIQNFIVIITIYWIACSANALVYDITDNPRDRIDYLVDSRGNCEDADHHTISQGSQGQNDCENDCEDNSKCTGYVYSSGSCVLKKNMYDCLSGDRTSGTYYAKHLGINFTVPGYGDKISDAKLADSKYCVHVPPNAKIGDKLFSAQCEGSGHEAQTFYLDVVDSDNYRLKYIKQLPKVGDTPVYDACIDIHEFMLDKNPVRLWECLDASGTYVDEQRYKRMYFKFGEHNLEIIGEPSNYAGGKIKVRLTTTYLMSDDMSTGFTKAGYGECDDGAIDTIVSTDDNPMIITEHCAKKCSDNTNCKSFSFSKVDQTCILREVSVCDKSDYVGDSNYGFFTR